MLYREIIAVCSEIHTNHKYTVWVERRIANVKLAVHIVTTGLDGVNFTVDNHAKLNISISPICSRSFIQQLLAGFNMATNGVIMLLKHPGRSIS